MVDDVVTDPVRIAELLASELTGLETGALADIEVTDADPDATPSPDGTPAYAITAAGSRLGRVLLSPDEAVVVLDGVEASADALSATVEAVERDGLAVEVTDDSVRARITTGAAVKGAVDLLRSLARSA